MQEDTLHYYLREERSSDKQMLQETPSPSNLVDNTIFAAISLSAALIMAFAWTNHLIELRSATVIAALASFSGIYNIIQVARKAKQLRNDLEHQIYRKYEYWMPDHADLPANHPRAQTDTT